MTVNHKKRRKHAAEPDAAAGAEPGEGWWGARAGLRRCGYAEELG